MKNIPCSMNEVNKAIAKAVKAVRNVNKVPKKAWAKWPTAARHVFNTTYGELTFDCIYPETAKNLTANARQVIAWNAAWVAADACKQGVLYS